MMMTGMNDIKNKSAPSSSLSQMQPQVRLLQTGDGESLEGQGKDVMNASLLVDGLLEPLEAEHDVEHAVDQQQVSRFLDLEVCKHDVCLRRSNTSLNRCQELPDCP